MLASDGKIASSGVLETVVAVNGGEGSHPLRKFGESNGLGSIGWMFVSCDGSQRPHPQNQWVRHPLTDRWLEDGDA
jgi:hypothetical protein